MYAGIGAGVFADASDASARCVKTGIVYEPDRALNDIYHDAYQRYIKLIELMNDNYY